MGFPKVHLVFALLPDALSAFGVVMQIYKRLGHIQNKIAENSLIFVNFLYYDYLAVHTIHIASVIEANPIIYGWNIFLFDGVWFKIAFAILCPVLFGVISTMFHYFEY